MTTRYQCHCGSIYEVFTGMWTTGKKKETILLCQRISCAIENAVINEPYPIDPGHIEKMVKIGLWVKI